VQGYVDYKGKSLFHGATVTEWMDTHPLLGKVAFVAHQHLEDIFACVLSDVSHPTSHACATMKNENERVRVPN
jgi:hypothetical protein